MTAYAVHVEVETSTPGPNVCDALAELLPESSVGHRLGRSGYTVTLVVNDARDALEAGRMAAEQVAAAAGGLGLATGPVVALEVLSESVRDARLEESPLPELVGSSEAAELLGVSRQRVHQLVHSHPEFPAPVARVSGGPIWLASQIHAFTRRWDRRPGRPRAAGPAA